VLNGVDLSKMGYWWENQNFGGKCGKNW